MERDQNVARENVRRLTRLRGWSLKELAEAAGLSASSVYNWSKTNEPNELGPKAINAIAEALEVLPEHLFYNPPHEQAGAPSVELVNVAPPIRNVAINSAHMWRTADTGKSFAEALDSALDNYPDVWAELAKR